MLPGLFTPQSHPSSLPVPVWNGRLLRGGTRGDDARRLRAMLQDPKLGGGKFGPARYNRRGARHVAEFVIIASAPASRPQLAQRLADLLDSIRM